MEDEQATAIGYFNYAHSYAASAVALTKVEVSATHPDAPIRFLFHHAIEVYLKAYLLAHGLDTKKLKFEFGHKVRKLADGARDHGLVLSAADIQVIDQMDQTDNVMSSRYVRFGIHQLLPLDALHECCFRLNEAIGHEVYAGSGVTRIPVLEKGPMNRLVELHIDSDSPEI